MSEYLSVSKLNQYIKSIVESDFSLMNITLLGEVSTLTKHYTGHFYFTLKDETSQIKCMMFSSYASKIGFDLKNGDQVLVQGYVGVYDKGGTYQFYCRTMTPYGEGQYLLFLARLKEKLQKEGLFDKPKKKLPLLPQKIGLITAKTGAAIHDFLTTVKRRTKVEVYIFPSLVQGENAPSSICEAIDLASNFDLDLLVITRGGGSKEDLKCFNDETLVRKAASLNIPLITAVGHQVDTTLIDYVADLTCITPTDAAMHATPIKDELVETINDYLTDIYNLVNNKHKRYEEKLMLLCRTIEAYSPVNKLKQEIKKLDNLNKRLEFINKIKINNYLANLIQLDRAIDINFSNYLTKKLKKLNYISDKLNYLNPYNLLNNGYSLLENKEGKILSSIKEIKIEDKVYINLSDGSIEAMVINVKEK